jgi:hypothetical protein
MIPKNHGGPSIARRFHIIMSTGLTLHAMLNLAFHLAAKANFFGLKVNKLQFTHALYE